MQMFTPLSASGGTVSSEFYLAQIDAVHAGKTVEIKLWDPGDTNPLAANLQIEIPTSGGWAATPFDWSATKGTTNANAQNCDSLTPGTAVSSVQTNEGATTGTFNGCWLKGCSPRRTSTLCSRRSPTWPFCAATTPATRST